MIKSRSEGRFLVKNNKKVASTKLVKSNISVKSYLLNQTPKTNIRTQSIKPSFSQKKNRDKNNLVNTSTWSKSNNSSSFIKDSKKGFERNKSKKEFGSSTKLKKVPLKSDMKTKNLDLKGAKKLLLLKNAI